MSRFRRLLPVVLLLIGAIVLASGALGAFTYFRVPKQAMIHGTQVINLTQCSGGYGVGTCPVVELAWSGTLVSSQPGLNGTLRDVWNLRVDKPGEEVPLTCGFPATYQTNIPTSASGPIYQPIEPIVSGVLSSGETAYVYTLDRYTVADGCGGDTFARVGTQPATVNATYSIGSGSRNVAAVPFRYDFSLINDYWAIIEIGLFTMGFGAAAYLIKLDGDESAQVTV